MSEGKFIISLFIVQAALIFFFVMLIILLLRIKHNILLDRKFKNYTINKENEQIISFFDKIFLFFNKIVNIISKLLTKLKIFDKYSKRYEKHIDFEELEIKNGMYYVSIKTIIAFCVLILYFVTQIFQYLNISLLGATISFVIGFFIPDIFVMIEYKKRRKEVEEDLLQAIIIMNGAFKSGRSTMQAIEIVKNELTGAIGDEFKKIHLDISYGLSLETVFERFYTRVKLEDAKYITSSLTLLNKTGGNIVKVFASVEREFFNKKKLADELKTMTSSSMFMFRILLFVPIVIFIAIFILNNTYYTPFFQSTFGILAFSLILLLYVTYVITIRRILRVDI